MKQGRSAVVAMIGIGIVGVCIGLWVGRQGVARRYEEALAIRRNLELQAGEAAAVQGRLHGELELERQRSLELSEALAATRGQLEEAVGRLTEESRSARELKARLAGVQRQMEQLQGELVVALEAREGSVPPASAGPVQLERVVVSGPGSPRLQGRVMSVHQDWNFIIVDLGWDAVRIGDTVSVFRDDRLLAKARVERVQEGICAAAILPEWKAAEIRVSDLARVL